MWGLEVWITEKSLRIKPMEAKERAGRSLAATGENIPMLRADSSPRIRRLGRRGRCTPGEVPPETSALRPRPFARQRIIFPRFEQIDEDLGR